MYRYIIKIFCFGPCYCCFYTQSNYKCWVKHRICGNRRICFHSEVKYNNPIISAVCIQGVMKLSFNVFAYLWSLNRHVASFFKWVGGSSRLIQKFLTSEKRTSFINQENPNPRGGNLQELRFQCPPPLPAWCFLPAQRSRSSSMNVY